MACIAIIDDNTDHSSTVKLNIEMGLEDLGSDLNVITSLPFRDPNNYFEYLSSNEVSVLILDEKLNDQTIGDGGPVDYKGSDLVSVIRKRLPDFPIFALTVIPGEGDLKAKYNLYEEIISRQEFYDDSNKWVPKFWRAAKNYLKENVDEFSQFNILTKEIAGGSTDPEKINRLQALQIKLELPYSGFEDRNQWLSEYEKQIEQLEKINKMLISKTGGDELEKDK